MESEKVCCRNCGIDDSETSEDLYKTEGRDWQHSGPGACHRAEREALAARKAYISHLEEALSLSPENVERVARTCHLGIDIYFPSKREQVLMEAAAFIRAIRLIAGLEGTDNNQLRETPGE